MPEGNCDVILAEAATCQVREDGSMTEPVAVLANAYKTVAFQPAGIEAGL
jgi:hypothetical protein